MKNLIKYFTMVMVLGSGATHAQNSSIDSKHNYKRPVFQQKAAIQSSNGITVFSQSKSAYQVKNNIHSVHNYKRKGVRDFASESVFVVEMPIKNETAFNPLLSSHNYKLHFLGTKSGKRLITNANRNEYDSLSLN